MFLQNMRASTGALWNFPPDFNDVATVPSVSAGINRHAPIPAVFCNPVFSYNHPFLVPFGIAAAPDHPPLSSLEYIANVSFVNYLALVLCINFFLSPPSCRSPEDPSLPLITLVRRLSQLFLLLYNDIDIYVADPCRKIYERHSLAYSLIDIVVLFSFPVRAETIDLRRSLAYSLIDTVLSLFRFCTNTPTFDNNNNIHNKRLCTIYNVNVLVAALAAHTAALRSTTTTFHTNDNILGVTVAIYAAPHRNSFSTDTSSYATTTTANDSFSIDTYATTTTFHNNNNNFTTCNRDCIYFSNATNNCSATRHDRLLDHGRVLYLIVMQILFVIYNTNITFAIGFDVAILDRETSICAYLQDISVDIAIALATAVVIEKVYLAIAYAIAMALATKLYFLAIGIIKIRFIHLQDIDILIAIATAIAILGIGIAIAIVVTSRSTFYKLTIAIDMSRSTFYKLTIAIDIAVSLIFLSSLEDHGRVLYFLAIGTMKIRFIHLQDIDIAFATGIGIGIDVAIAIAIAIAMLTFLIVVVVAITIAISVSVVIDIPTICKSKICESNFIVATATAITIVVTTIDLIHESNFIITIAIGNKSIGQRQRPRNSLSCLAIAVAIAVAVTVPVAIDIPINRILPNVQHLQRIENGDPIPAETDKVPASEFQFFLHPFAKIAVAVALAIAIVVTVAEYYKLAIYESTNYESHFVIAIAIAVLANANAFATDVAIKHDYLAIAVALAIAFVIPLQSETALSSLSLTHFDISIPQVLVGTNELHNDLRKRRSTTGFANTYCTKPLGWILHSRHAPRLMSLYG